MYLVKFSSDWADEFTAEGFAIVDMSHQEIVDRVEKTCENGFSFGTNEYFEECELDESCFTIEAIRDNDAVRLLELFKTVNGRFGIFPYWL